MRERENLIIAEDAFRSWRVREGACHYVTKMNFGAGHQGEEAQADYRRP